MQYMRAQCSYCETSMQKQNQREKNNEKSMKKLKNRVLHTMTFLARDALLATVEESLGND